MSAIDGLKWFASRFRPNLLSERADRPDHSLSRTYPRATSTGPQEHPDQSEVSNLRREGGTTTALTTSGSDNLNTSWLTNAPGRISQIGDSTGFKKNCANREGDLF